MDTTLLTSVLQRLVSKFTDSLPAIITILIILFVGWGVARLFAGLVKKFVKRLQLNKGFISSGFTKELDIILPGRTLADLTSSVTFWLLWLYIILTTLTSSDFNLGTIPLADLLSFLPHLFVAFLILVGGVLLAQYIGRWVQVGVAATGVEYDETLGKGARLLLITIAIITAIEELGIDLTPLTNALTNIITIFFAGLALAFGMGARDTVRNILAGYYARERFSLGEQVGIDGRSGTLDAIGTVNAEITLPDGRLIIPNSNLTDKVVKVK